MRESINPYLQLHVANDGRVEIMALAKARTTDADSVAVGGREDRRAATFMTSGRNSVGFHEHGQFVANRSPCDAG